jgi:hypothetical protein
MFSLELDLYSFSRKLPGIIWTHLSFADENIFRHLSASQPDRPCMTDGIANAILFSEKAKHLAQLIFTALEIVADLVTAVMSLPFAPPSR